MFFSRKKNHEPVDLSWLHTDMHSHLIPGIDDGSPDMETTLDLIRGFESLGYKKIITTPHILWSIYRNNPEIILSGLEAVRNEVSNQGIEIEINAAAEYFIDEHFMGLLENKTPLLKISSNMVLVEISMVNLPMDLQEVFFEMQLQDYQPVIAHPERYVYLSRNKEFFTKIRDAGCMFQLNLLSICGHYGSQVKDLAEYLLKNEFYDLVGTDLHHQGHLDAIRKINPAILRKIKDSGTIRNKEL